MRDLPLLILFIMVLVGFPMAYYVGYVNGKIAALKRLDGEQQR